MKKFVAILVICVLAGSFLFGAIATAQNGPGGGHNNLPPSCFYNPKYPGVCNTTTCRLYVTYTCPWGNVLVWEGDFCCDPGGIE